MARQAVRTIVLILTLASIQPVKAIERPILTEKDVKTEIVIKQLDKDDLQRLFEKMTDNINELEKRVADLENDNIDLKDRVGYLELK